MMVQCRLSGAEIDSEAAYLINKNTIKKLIKLYRGKVARLEELVANYGPIDSVELEKSPGKKIVVHRHRFVSEVAARALSLAHEDKFLFIRWIDHCNRNHDIQWSHLKKDKEFGHAASSIAAADFAKIMRFGFIQLSLVGRYIDFTPRTRHGFQIIVAPIWFARNHKKCGALLTSGASELMADLLACGLPPDCAAEVLAKARAKST